MQKIATVSKYIFLGLLAYMPVHIFLSTIIGVNVGWLDLMKALKDIVLMFGFCLVAFASIRQPWFTAWLKNSLTVVIIVYVLVTGFLALVRPTDIDAEILGVVYNTRFLVFFLYASLLQHHFNSKKLQKAAVKTVLVVASCVVGFGIVQYAVLPDDALRNLGFTRENGVFPAFFIDDKPDLERVMSTVRDPNSLGSYLIVIIPLIVASFYQARQKQKKWWLVYLLASFVCMYVTFSRSAWLGLVASLAVFAGLSAYKRQRIRISNNTKRTALITGLVGFIVVAGLLFVGRDSYYVQNVILHSDESTVQEDPNELRIRFWQESVQSISDQPLGSGPGTAGLASIRNNIQGTQLNENYYLQIATEVGFIGISLFILILIIPGIRLYHLARENIYALALFASFVGLIITNFLVHIWSNEAVAYTWWGLAGLFIIYKPKAKHTKV